LDIFEKFSIVIIPVLLTALFYSVIPRKLKEREIFTDAAATFRSKILTALEGIYPIVRPWWDESDFPRFSRSVNMVESAATEFRCFIKRKREFDIAVKAYREYCKKQQYEGALARNIIPDIQKPGEISPLETFNNIVEHLLSFTKRKW